MHSGWTFCFLFDWNLFKAVNMIRSVPLDTCSYSLIMDCVCWNHGLLVIIVVCGLFVYVVVYFVSENVELLFILWVQCWKLHTRV